MNINLDEVEMGNMEDLNALYAIFQCFFYFMKALLMAAWVLWMLHKVQVIA